MNSLELRWTTLDGRTLALHEITDTHLQNIVLHVRRRMEYRAERDRLFSRRVYEDAMLLIEVLLPELEKRGLPEVTEEIPWERPSDE